MRSRDAARARGSVNFFGARKNAKQRCVFMRSVGRNRAERDDTDGQLELGVVRKRKCVCVCVVNVVHWCSFYCLLE